MCVRVDGSRVIVDEDNASVSQYYKLIKNDKNPLLVIDFDCHQLKLDTFILYENITPARLNTSVSSRACRVIYGSIRPVRAGLLRGQNTYLTNKIRRNFQ